MGTANPSLNVSTSESNNYADAFRTVAEQVSNKLAEYGLTILPYRTADLPHYNALSAEQRRKALKNIEVYWTSIQMAEASGDRFDDGKRALWHALSAVKLVPPSDTFSKIPPGSAIEIYDMEGIQIWRNWEVMRVCSYTLEEIHSIEWHRRYERETAANARCFEIIRDVVTGAVDEIYDPKMPMHWLQESCSMEGFRFDCQFTYVIRLKDRDGDPAGFLLIAEVANAKKTRPLDMGPGLYPVEA